MAASAAGAPSGQEYLPKVPSATGDKSAATGGSESAPVATTSTSTTSASAGTTPKKHNPGKAKPGKTKATAVTPAASTDDSSGGGIGIAPIIILIIGGVIVAAAGMTLRGRHGGGGDRGEEPGREDPGPRPNARPTPDGEIVASGDDGT